LASTQMGKLTRIRCAKLRHESSRGKPSCMHQRQNPEHKTFQSNPT
jgi:hypothetical protein